MKNHMLTTAFALSFGLLFALEASAAGPVLVENGVSRMPIVVPEDAAPFTRRAADDLAEYIERSCAASASRHRPAILVGRPDPLPESAVWVGFQPALTEVFPGLDFDFQHPEEILIAANDSHLVIAGRDRWRPGDDRQFEYGTANAVYTFLQDYLDVRWLWPGELGQDTIPRERIAFEPFEFRYHPQMRGRSEILRFSALDGRGGVSRDWVRFQRLQLDSLTLPGGHAFTTWWERFGETHPEYFALQPDGTRSGFPAPRTVKMCKSNPALWQQWLADVEAQLEANPTRTVFNASPNDSWMRGFCVCEHCQAWDHPDGEPRQYSWDGVSATRPALSDRHVIFANHCARLLRERFPDEDYYVLMTAYGNSRPAPDEAVPDDNVIISSVALFLLRDGQVDRGSTWGTTHEEQFAGWGRVTENLVWRPNTGSPVGWHQGLPDIPLAKTAEHVKFVAEHGCKGIFIDTVWEHWATQGPLYYLMGQLAWNPDADPQVVMKDYYRRGFGEAAQAVEAYWSLLEEARETYYFADATGEQWRNRPGTRSYTEVYDEAFYARAEGYLSQAAEAVAYGPGAHRRRVEYVRAGFEYTRLLNEARAAMAQWSGSDRQDAEAEARARRVWDDILRLSQQHPDAMNWLRLEPRHGRTASFHPDGRDTDLRLGR